MSTQTASHTRQSAGVTGPFAPSAPPILISSATKAAAVLTLVFNQNVMLHGTPVINVNVLDVLPLSAVQTAPDTVEITYSDDVSVANRLTITHRDPAIRNAAGGYLICNTRPIT
ncbi:MAG TPA: hypothetical protein VIL86_12580 [Tepidisphaeraceae bacterium]|jgi:hypothetical protein